VVALHAQPFLERHTGVNIGETIHQMIEDFDIPKHKIHCIVHDSASNMVKGIADQTEFPSLNFFSHITQLALEECIFKQQSVLDIGNNLKSIYSHFNKSYIAMGRLKKIQKQLGHKELVPLNSNSTRWDIYFTMFNRASNIKDLILFASKYNDSFAELTYNDWSLLEKLLQLLSLFYFITKDMINRYANCGGIIPFIKIFKDYVIDELTKLDAQVCSQLSKP